MIETVQGSAWAQGLSDLRAESVRARARAERMCVARAVRRARSWSKGTAHMELGRLTSNCATERRSTVHRASVSTGRGETRGRDDYYQ